MTEFTYRAYGLLIRSEIELPELAPVSDPVAAGVVSDDPARRPVIIETGEVPDRLDGEFRLASWLSHAGERWLVTVPDVGRLLIESGDRIVAQQAHGAHASDLRTYLFGTGFATILLQRGLIPLHVSALLSPVGAIAFTGPSGAGKSTAAATLHAELGWPIICDDVAVLSERGGKAVIEGGVRRLRLWSDAIDRLDWSTDGLVRDIHRRDKFLVQDTAPFVEGIHDLAALYEIDLPRAGTEANPNHIRGAQRFQVLMNAIHRPYIAARTRGASDIQPATASLCKKFDFFRGPRPSRNHIECVMELLRHRQP